MGKKEKQPRKKGKALFLLVFLLLVALILGYAGLISSTSSKVLTVVKRKSQKFQAQLLEERKSYWFWEKIIPNFLEVLEYPLDVQQLAIEFEYQLPETTLYSRFIVGEPQFIYRLKLNIDYLLTRQSMAELIMDGTLATPEQLSSYYLEQEEILRNFLQKEFRLGKTFELEDIALYLQEQLQQIAPQIQFKTVVVSQWQQPDWQLYEQARSNYQSFVSSRGQQLIEENIIDYLLQNRTQAQLQRLKNLGEILEKYPQILEYFKTVGEIQPNWKVEDILPLS